MGNYFKNKFLLGCFWFKYIFFLVTEFQIGIFDKMILPKYSVPF